MDIFRKIKPSETEANELQKKLREIDSLTAAWQARQRVPEPRYEALQPAIEATIAASLALENMPCSPAAIHKTLSQEPDTTDKRACLIVGYNTILHALYTDAQKYPLCEDTIVALHSALFPHGKNNPKGKEGTARPAAVNFLDYKAPTLFNRNRTVSVNSEIGDLVEWTNRELTQRSHHPLVVIAAFAYEFISIHPFREGKGELSRILSTLLMLQNRYEWAREVSVDSFIERRRTTYYQTLKRGQQNRYSSQEEITPWVLFLCDTWLQSLHSLMPEQAGTTPASPRPAETVVPATTEPTVTPLSPVVEAAPPIYLNARQKQILACLKRKEPAKVSDIAHALKTISINTLKKDLLYLRQKGLIESHGVLKGTIYTLKK